MWPLVKTLPKNQNRTLSAPGSWQTWACGVGVDSTGEQGGERPDPLGCVSMLFLRDLLTLCVSDLAPHFLLCELLQALSL